MKVVKARPPWKHKFTCKGCQTELEAEASDVRIGTFNACYYAGDNGEQKYYVKCSVCGTDHIVPDSRVPQDVANGAKADRD
jgi:hypothetical protein